MTHHTSNLLSEDADDLRRITKLKAGNARWLRAQHDTAEALYRSLCGYAGDSGIVPAESSEKSGLDGANRRMCDERWWRRRLKRAETRAIESAAIEIGLVHKKREIYVSKEKSAEAAGTAATESQSYGDPAGGQ